MAKSKQTNNEVAQDEPFLFAIGTPEGDMMVKVGVDGNIMYIKEGVSLTDASKAFWDSFQVFLPITIEEVETYTSDEELGAYVRARMANKFQNQ
jgi:hypothetical protein